MQLIETLILIITGLSLFLYGIFHIGESLLIIFDAKIKKITNKIMDKPFQAFFCGILISALIHSSSATIAITISLAAIDIISYRQAINILLGANIGTTLSSIIVILDLRILIPCLLLIGLILSITKNEKKKNGGQILFCLGLIIFGLELFGSQLSAYSTNPFFLSLVKSFSLNPLLGLLVGIIVTGIIQSSTAFIGILKSLFSSYTPLPVTAITSLLLGANIGTTLDGFLATTNKKSRKIAFFNLWFNVIGALICLILLPLYSSLSLWIINIFSLNVASSIILIHFLFNIITSFIALILINYTILKHRFKS